MFSVRPSCPRSWCSLHKVMPINKCVFLSVLFCFIFVIMQYCIQGSTQPVFSVFSGVERIAHRGITYVFMHICLHMLLFGFTKLGKHKGYQL